MRRRYLILGGLAALAFVLDQLSKWWVMTAIPEHRPVVVIPGFFDLINIRNRGAAFGFLNRSDIEWQFWLFLAATVVAAWAIIALVRGSRHQPWLFAGLGLVLGGMGLVSLIGAGLMLLGLPLLLCKKHPWLWMGWTAVAISLLVFNPHTSVSPWGLFGGMRYLYWILTNPELRYYASYFAAAIGILRGSLILLLIFLGIRARRMGSGAEP